jgi:hypothetical protein
MRASYGGKCIDCAGRIEQGSPMRYDGSMHHLDCDTDRSASRSDNSHTQGGPVRSVKPTAEDLAWMRERNPDLVLASE